MYDIEMQKTSEDLAHRQPDKESMMTRIEYPTTDCYGQFADVP